MSTIYDLSSKCIIFNKRHCFTENSFSGTPQPSRKRRLDENLLKNPVPDENPNFRRRLVPLHKQFTSTEFPHSPNLLFFNLNGGRIRDASINAIISPQLNVSYKVLKTDAKSSTPLNEDNAMISMGKENIAMVSISVQQDATVYCTPENPIGTSLILVSAMKKTISSPSRNTRKFSDGRKVTFDTASPSDEEISVYGTPGVSLGGESEEATFSHEMIIVSPAINENVESNFPDETDFSNEPEEHKLAKVARNMRLTLNGIPRSLTSIWEWTQRRIRRKKHRDEFDSPVGLRNRMKANLKRRPISSYWVSMSITSMVRDPLPNYKEKYSAFQGTE